MKKMDFANAVSAIAEQAEVQGDDATACLLFSVAGILAIGAENEAALFLDPFIKTILLEIELIKKQDNIFP